MSTNPISIRVKWAGPNTPYIKIGNERIYLSKKELQTLSSEISEFIDYYKESFSIECIDITDETCEYENAKKE